MLVSLNWMDLSQENDTIPMSQHQEKSYSSLLLNMNKHMEDICTNSDIHKAALVNAELNRVIYLKGNSSLKIA